MATIVEGDLKAPFSCRGERYVFPWIAPLYPWSLPYNAVSVKQGGIKYHFLSFWYDSTGIDPKSPEPLGNTLTLMPKSGYSTAKICTIGLNFLYCGISTFIGYSMPKLSLQKNSRDTIQTHSWGTRGFMPFPRILVKKKM